MKRTSKSTTSSGNVRLTVEPTKINAADYPAALQRVIRAARKGGATEADIQLVMMVPAFTSYVMRPIVTAGRRSRAGLAKSRHREPRKADVKAIRAAMRTAKSVKDVARKLGVSRNTASKYMKEVAQL